MKRNLMLRRPRSLLIAIWLIITWVGLMSANSALIGSTVYAVQDSNQPVESKNRLETINQFGFESFVPDEVEQAAVDGLEPFLQIIPVQDLEHYGFPPGRGFDAVSLGQPYRVFTIDPTMLFDYDADEDLRSIVTPTTIWFFPVLQNGEPRSILTVDFIEGQWAAVAIGNSGLAEQLHDMEQTWSDARSYGRIFVRVFQATSDVLVIVKDGVVNLQPFESARVSLSLDDLKKDVMGFYTTPEIVHRLIPVVQNNLNLDME